MFEVEADKPGQILTLRYADQVGFEETKRCLEEVRTLVEEMKPGFRALTDLSKLASMDSACAPDIAAIMDLLREKGLKSAVRVIPDPHKDIGLNILSQFHYGPAIRTEAHDTLEQALKVFRSEDS